MKPWLLITFIIILFFSCENEKPIPENLKIAFNYLDKNWDDSQRETFKTLNKKAVSPVYYGYNIENELQNILLKNHEIANKLNAFLDSLDIKRPQSKSGVILNTYFDYIRNNEISIDTEVKRVKAYWKPIEVCENNLKTKAISVFDEFKINDKIIIDLPVDEHNNAVDFKCPNVNWSFIENKDLKIEVLILDKKISIDSMLANFQVKLLNKSKPHTEILLEEYYKGDVFNISLYNCWKFRKACKTDANTNKPL